MKLNHVCFALLALCLFSCDDNDSSKVNDDIGKPCNDAEFVSHCDGNTVIVCENDVISQHECSRDKNLTCAVFKTPVDNECEEDDEDCQDAQTKSRIACISKDLACKTKGDTYQKCVTNTSGSSQIKTFQCTNSTDGRLFYRNISHEQCHNGYGTCTETGECASPVECDFENYCKDDVLYQCNKQRLRINDCSSHATPATCVVINDTPQCRTQKEICTKEGKEIVSSCSANQEHLKICTKADDGKMYYVTSGTRKCLAGCNEKNTACAEIPCTSGEIITRCRLAYSTAYIDKYECRQHDDTWTLTLIESEKCPDGLCSESGTCAAAEDCTSKEYVSHCKGNTAMTCAAKKEKELRCDLQTSSTCEIINGKASCYSESKECLKENEERAFSCNVNTSKEFLQICSKAESGKLFWVNNGSRECAKGCNEDRTACAK